VPSRNAHSTARPAPAPRAAAGARVPAALREKASAAVDAALKALAATAADETRRLQWLGDEDAALHAQGLRVGADEVRACLKRRRALDRLTPLDDLARGCSAAWRRGADEAYTRAHALYDAVVAGAREEDGVAAPRDQSTSAKDHNDER